MQWCAKGLSSEYVLWAGRFILMLVGFVFVDTVRRLHSLDSALHDRHDHHHSHVESPLGKFSELCHALCFQGSILMILYIIKEDLQYKTKLFYSQRNLYLSAMSLFMVV
jgi:hypothetical protein